MLNLGGVAEGPISIIGALKILALPKRGGGSAPCQHFFGGFDILYRGQPKGIIDPQK